MTKRRPTLEQQRAALQLGTLAAPYRFRVIADAEGFPIIPGRYGRIEWYYDGVNCWSCPLPRKVGLAVYSDRPRLFQKLRAISGVLRHQSGDGGCAPCSPSNCWSRWRPSSGRSGGVGLGLAGLRTSRSVPDNWPLHGAPSRFRPGTKGGGGTPRIPAGIVMISTVRTLPLILRAFMDGLRAEPLSR